MKKIMLLSVSICCILLAACGGDSTVDDNNIKLENAAKTTDSDNDGTVDYSDAFPNDATEIADSDQDGTGDNSDAFPKDGYSTCITGENFSIDATEALDSAQEGTSDLAGALIINEDSSNFFITREEKDMTLAGVNAFVDQYADTAVTHLFFCPNAMRASFSSKTREAIWDVTGNEDFPTGNNIARWPDNARLLHERGLDPYALWIARSREKGISPWISMRMNDVHEVSTTKSFMHSSFWQSHPEFWRVPYGEGVGGTGRALNYVHPEVREYNLAFVNELLERYDPDGLELDWMRAGRHLTPGKESEEGPILTEFVRQVRALTREWALKRGHPILLAVRVPSHPDAAAGLGMDAVTWAREGLVDLLIPAPFWTTSDFDIPVELWKQRLGDEGASVLMAPGLEYHTRPWPGGKAKANDLPHVYGFAASARARGADATYLFNYMDGFNPIGSSSDYRVLLEKGVGADYIAGQERRFPVAFRDTVPDCFPRGVSLPVQDRKTGTFRIYTGGSSATGEAFIVFGLAEKAEVMDSTWNVTVNGQPASAAIDLPDCTAVDCTAVGGGAVRALRFAVPSGVLKSGYARVTVQQTEDGPAQTVVWAEILITP
jgi:hypothetical protein